MKNLKLYIWLLGACIVLVTIWLNPQYAEEAARAIMIIVGETPCDCK